MMKGPLAGLLLLTLLVSPTLAKESVYGMSKKTYDAINKVQVLIEEEKFEEAIAEVELVKERKLNGYEMAHVLNMAGFLHFQLEDNDAALAAYNWGPGHISGRLRRGRALPTEYPRLVSDALAQNTLKPARLSLRWLSLLTRRLNRTV